MIRALATALLIAVVAAVAAGPASAAPRSRRPPAPSRGDLAQSVADLEEKVAALKKELALRADQRTAALEVRIAVIETRLLELKNGPATGAVDADKLQELEDAITELREEGASKGDLKKYVRKPDEKEFKSRTSQELELRLAFTDLREGELEDAVTGLGMLARDPTLGARGRAILAAVGGLGEQLLANDARARPRMLFRLYWEANRFIGEGSYLFVSAMPELQLYVYDQDVDRVLIPRDVARPRDRLGLIFKKAAAGVQLGRVGLQAGVLQFTYGAGFFVNPTNVFTPKSPLDPRREVDGVPAVKLDLTLLQGETTTLTFQAAGIGRMVRNDLLADHGDELQLGALGILKLDTSLISLTGIGIYQNPDDLGRDDALSFGGIASITPFGLTTSVEALFSKAPFDGGYQPNLVASIQGFTPKIGANGMTYILEYLYSGDQPGSAAEAGADLARAVRAGESFFVVDRLTRPLGRRHYANLYLEPSLTQRLRVNLAGLVGFDEATGALVRAGFDYELFNFTVHAFGGVLLGADDSEFRHHFIQSFAEVAVFAGF